MEDVSALSGKVILNEYSDRNSASAVIDETECIGEGFEQPSSSVVSGGGEGGVSGTEQTPSPLSDSPVGASSSSSGCDSPMADSKAGEDAHVSSAKQQRGSGKRGARKGQRGGSDVSEDKVGVQVEQGSDNRGRIRIRIVGNDLQSDDQQEGGRNAAPSRKRKASDRDGKSEEPSPHECDEGDDKQLVGAKRRKQANPQKSSQKERLDGSISFMRGYAKSHKSKDKPKGISLKEVEKVVSEAPAKAAVELAFLLPLMLFLQKNTINIKKVVKSPTTGKVSIVTDEGKVFFDQMVKKLDGDDLKMLKENEERYTREYWKIPKGDYDKVNNPIQKGLKVQIILNSVQLVSFPDQSDSSKTVYCVVPSFRYEPLLS